MGGIRAKRAECAATVPRPSNPVLAGAPAVPIRAFLVGCAGPAAAIKANIRATLLVASMVVLWFSLFKRREGFAGLAETAVPVPTNIRAYVAITQPRLALSVRVACAAVW